MDTKDLTKLSQDLECAVCMEVFTDPRVLICQHVFCLGCLEKLAKDRGMITCPTCRKDSLIDSDTGVACLPKPVVINNVSDTLAMIQQKHECEEAKGSKGVIICKLCEDRKAEVFCHECIEYLCKQCNDTHLKIAGFSAHKISLLESLIQCDSHMNNTCKHFCDACCIPVCIKCLFESHKEHPTRDLEQIYEEKRAKVEEYINSLTTTKVKLIGVIDSAHIEERKIEHQFKNCESEVLQWFEKIQELVSKVLSMIEADKEESLEPIRQTIKTKQSALDEIELKMGDLEYALSSKTTILKTCPQKESPINNHDEDFNIGLKSKPEVTLSKLCVESLIDYKLVNMKSTDKAQTENKSYSEALVHDVPKQNKPQAESAETLPYELQKQSSSMNASSEVKRDDGQSVSVGKWKVKSRVVLDVYNIIDAVCAEKEQKIFCRLRNFEKKEEFAALDFEGKKIKSVCTQGYCNDTGIAYNSKKNQVIMAYQPKDFRVYTVNGDFCRKFYVENIEDNSKMAYSETYDGLVVMDQFAKTVYLVKGYIVKMKLCVKDPGLMAIDERTEMIAVSSKTEGKINMYDMNGSLKGTIKHRFVTKNSDVCFNSGVLYGCNKHKDQTDVIVWGVPVRDCFSKSPDAVITRSDITNNIYQIVKVTNDKMLILDLRQLLFLKRK